MRYAIKIVSKLKNKGVQLCSDRQGNKRGQAKGNKRGQANNTCKPLQHMLKSGTWELDE